MQTDSRPRLAAVAVLLFWCYVAVNVYFALTPIFGGPSPMMMRLVPILLGSFSLVHAACILGFRNASVFLCLCYLICFPFEVLGTATGFVYGGYHYTDLLGPKLFGVPVLIPLAYFMVLYLCHNLANFIVYGWEHLDRHERTAKILGLAFCTAMFLAGWDMVLDVFMVARGYWVWHDGGTYFGTPVRNYFGWMFTGTIVSFAYRLLERRMSPKCSHGVSARFQLLPVIMYGVLWAGFVLGHVLDGNSELGLIGLFSMGVPFLIVLVRVS